MKADIMQFKVKEITDTLAMQQALQAQVDKEANDIQHQNDKWALLLGSVQGITFNSFQPQIDIINQIKSLMKQ